MPDPFILWESDLSTRHPKGHPRVRKPVRTYMALVFDRAEVVDGRLIPIYRAVAFPTPSNVRGWYEEDPEAALRGAEDQLKAERKP